MKTALSRILRASFPIVDGLCEEFSESGFSPAFFELKISGASDDGPAPVEIHGQGGEKIFVYGTIDRVDTMKSGDNVFVRVVDYKTGSKEFQPDDIDDGKNLQMFLYLKSITDCKKKSFRKLLGVGEGGEILPAGLIYVKTEIKDQRVASPSDEAADAAVKAAQRRVGMILNDNEVIGATGEKYLPVKFTKSGEVDKRYAKYLYTPEDWNEISDRIDGVVGRIGHMISSGYIKSTSGKDKQKKSPCEWCKFKAFCRNIKL
jgi:ATP-dependent helicase/nuclease subunit B